MKAPAHLVSQDLWLTDGSISPGLVWQQASRRDSHGGGAGGLLQTSNKDTNPSPESRTSQGPHLLMYPIRDGFSMRFWGHSGQSHCSAVVLGLHGIITAAEPQPSHVHLLQEEDAGACASWGSVEAVETLWES